MAKLMNFQHSFNLIFKQICRFAIIQMLVINFKFTNCYRDRLDCQQLSGCFGR